MLKEYIRRFAVCILGLALYGLGNAFGVLAGSAGTNAWNTLSIGVGDIFGCSFGVANLIISAVVILVDLIGRGKIGFGTVLNIFIISIFSDLWIGLLRLLPIPDSTAVGVVFTLIGQLILSFSTILYMSPALGCGPRDTLMVILGKKLPNIPIGAVKFGIEVIVLVIGVLLGAPFGIGTVLVMALQASMFQLACKICRFEPRSLNHEDILDTVRRIGGSRQA
ncbi:MAG: hypothetical protein K6F56_08400 [Oscillospiraceae bacterium]|nr:hypothetical protein [Oscillospiraceae bacterium]